MASRVGGQVAPTLRAEAWGPPGAGRISQVATLQLSLGSAPGPAAVSLVFFDTFRPLAPPVQVLLELGDTSQLRETMNMSPLDLAPGLDIILGWDWIASRHDLHFLYPRGAVAGRSPAGHFHIPLLLGIPPFPPKLMF